MASTKGRGRLLPYYLYLATVAFALLPLGAIWLTWNDQSLVTVQLAFVVSALYLIFLAGLILANWHGIIRQLRGINRVQFSRWPWCRPVCRIVYRDTDTWWRIAAGLFAIGGLVDLIVIYAFR